MKSKSRIGLNGMPVRIKNRLNPGRKEGQSLKQAAEEEVRARGVFAADVQLWFGHKDATGKGW